MEYPILYRLPPAAHAKPSDRHPGIRWKAFFFGDLYANPLYDFADWVQDVTSRPPGVSAYGVGRLPIRFTEIGIEVSDKQATGTYEYGKMSDLKIHHQVWDSSISGLTPRGAIKFIMDEPGAKNGKRYAINFVFSEAGVIKVCQHLLRLKIPFKEYMAGARSHLGKIPTSYKEIQRIKKDTGIAW